MKFAATILALALATTHGLLEEGGPNVQKKDASKGLRGSAEVDSSLERTAVGRKLDFYYDAPCPVDTSKIPDPRFCNKVCSNDEKVLCDEAADCEEGGICEVEVTGIPPCDTNTCRCCDGKLPVPEGEFNICVFPDFVCSTDPNIQCDPNSGPPVIVQCGSVAATCIPAPAEPCENIKTCCDGTVIDFLTQRCPFEPGEGPCSFPPTTAPTSSEPTPQPTPCPKKLDVCVALDESGSVCSAVPGQPELCEDGECTATECTDTVPPSDECSYADSCSNFNTLTKVFTSDFIDDLKIQLELQVSVVEYGTQGILTSGLTTPDLAKAAVNGIAYSGGFTNLEEAIKECTETLEASTAEQKIMVVVGDGVATTDTSGFRCTGNNAGSMVCKTAAKEAADGAKLAGIEIATVHFDDVYLDDAGAKFFEEDIASGGKSSEGGLAFDPLAPPTAKELADALFERVTCE